MRQLQMQLGFWIALLTLAKIRGQGVNGKGEQAEGKEVRWGEVGPKKRQHVAVGQMDNLFTRRLVGSKMTALDSDSDDDNDNDNGGDS